VPIGFLAVANTLASTCGARPFRSPENLALLSIPVWNYALVSLLEVLLIGGELWDFYPQIDTVRRFPVYGTHGLLRESWEKQR
jgi:hypothetical protein